MKCKDCKLQKKASNCQACFTLEVENNEQARMRAERKYNNLQERRKEDAKVMQQRIEREQAKYRVFVIDLFTLITEVPWWKLRKTLKSFVEKEKK